jgi:hypothetical protein
MRRRLLPDHQAQSVLTHAGLGTAFWCLNGKTSGWRRCVLISANEDHLDVEGLFMRTAKIYQHTFKQGNKV